MLVCVHTRRDRCCGKYGFPLHKSLREDQVPNTRIWRTSHIKGHRTAPTMLDFPQGRFWGYMTTEIATKVRDQLQLTKDEWEHHYRGLVNLYPGEQLTDREALKKFGWDWTNHNLIVKSKKFKDKIRATLESGDNKVTVDFNKKGKKTEVGKTKCQKIKVKELQILDKLIN